MSRQEGLRRLALATIILIVIGLTAFWFFYKEKHYLEVSMLDIGQGDSELIETPHGQVILVDGGPDQVVLRRLGEELPFWQKDIDLVILTHPHTDHFVGLISVMQRYHVHQLFVSGLVYPGAAYEAFLTTVKEKHIPVTNIESPQELTIDGLTLKFLYPLHSFVGQKIANANNASIVFKLSYGTVDFLFTGDAEAPVEKELLVSEPNELAAQVLKLGHHGSDTSSTEDFLKAVNPKVATASAGLDNKFGHPSLIILKRLERLGIKSYRTDTDGTIHFESDGNWLIANKTCVIANCPL